MKRPIWFKAKTYGYGWYPATWQGWLMILLWVVLLGLNAWRLMSTDMPPVENTIEFVAETLVMTAVLIYISYKTGEPPRWRWGKDDK
ncbi:hypothetical protein IPH19_02745 [Candidatus Uhrbacteria bacterium]|nr:MAG: hypothetical protein IPH19_02745 [Candidatus Uhrbacteria bacterium]